MWDVLSFCNIPWMYMCPCLIFELSLFVDTQSLIVCWLHHISLIFCSYNLAVITTAQLHWTKTKCRFSTGSNDARGVSEIRDGEDFWQWSVLEIKPNAFRWSTIPQKQFTITTIIIIRCLTDVLSKLFLLGYLSIFYTAWSLFHDNAW